MIALLQRVAEARVLVCEQEIARIERGLLMLVCAEPGDRPDEAERLLHKTLKLRIFADAQGRMNHCVQDLDGQGRRGGLLIVSQFTLAADVSGGHRPSFTGAADPVMARTLYEHLLERARDRHDPVASGRFGADMQVQLCNDGPVTIPLRVAPPPRPQELGPTQ